MQFCEKELDFLQIPSVFAFWTASSNWFNYKLCCLPENQLVPDPQLKCILFIQQEIDQKHILNPALKWQKEKVTSSKSFLKLNWDDLNFTSLNKAILQMGMGQKSFTVIQNMYEFIQLVAVWY